MMASLHASKATSETPDHGKEGEEGLGEVYDAVNIPVEGEEGLRETCGAAGKEGEEGAGET